MTQKPFTPEDFARAVLEAQRIREASYVKGEPVVFADGTEFPTGSYQKDHMQAAAEALGKSMEDPMSWGMAYPLYLLNATVWNDIHDWAQSILGQTTKPGEADI